MNSNEGTAVPRCETCGQHNCDTHGCRHKHGHERGINANRTAGTGAGMHTGASVNRCRPECRMIAGKSAGTNASMRVGRCK